MRTTLLRLLRSERGAVFTEYVVIVGFVALVTVPAILFCTFAVAQRLQINRFYPLMPFP